MASDNLAGLEYSVLKLRLICFVFRPLFWPLKNVFKPENGLQKNPLAEPGLKIEIFASVNIATAFSDSVSNIHCVVYIQYGNVKNTREKMVRNGKGK